MCVGHSLRHWPSITKHDVDSSKFTSGFRVQRIEGEWWVSSSGQTSVQNRNAAMKIILFGLTQTENHSNNTDGLDFHMDVSDGNYNSGPVLAFCSNDKNAKAIMIPDNSFLSWPEMGHNMTYYELYRSLQAAGNKPKKSYNKVIFSGNMFPLRKELLEGSSNDYTDIQNTRPRKHKQGEQPHYRTLQETCQYPYLLHLPGGTSYSSRLKYLLLCNSTVIFRDKYTGGNLSTVEGADLLKNRSGDVGTSRIMFVTPEYEEWYYVLLKPWEHYIPARDGSEINNIMEALIANKTLALRVAENSAQLASTILHPSCVTRYWLALLHEYGRRMDYKVTVPAKGAVLLTNDLLAAIKSSEDAKQQHAPQPATKKAKEWFNKYLLTVK